MRDFNVQRRHLIDICLSLPAHSPSSPPPVEGTYTEYAFQEASLPPSRVLYPQNHIVYYKRWVPVPDSLSSTACECSAVYCLLLIHEFLIVRHDDDDDSMDPESKLFMFIPSLTNIIYIATEGGAVSGLWTCLLICYCIWWCSSDIQLSVNGSHAPRVFSWSQ